MSPGQGFKYKNCRPQRQVQETSFKESTYVGWCHASGSVRLQTQGQPWSESQSETSKEGGQGGGGCHVFKLYI